MNQLTVSTPALLFPCISLLILAYTNKFIAISKRIRNLHSVYLEHPSDLVHEQIKILKNRIFLIRNMQLLAILAFFFCVASMLAIVLSKPIIAQLIFLSSLLLMLGSLGFSLREIFLSVHALDIQLNDFEEEHNIH